ncbi:MAG: helix-turn-helix domain-containing protein [Anaerolineae bacterium]
MGETSSFASLVCYVEHNLYEGLTAEAVSRAGFVSLVQLYRDFYAYTGHSVKEYVRRRRLSNALALVRFSDVPMAEIAISHGYSSQQAFCRSVKAATGQTPLGYKGGDFHYYFPPHQAREGQPHVSVALARVPATLACDFYHPQLRGIEDLAVGQLLRALTGFGGRLFGRNGDQQGTRFCYELWVDGSAVDVDVEALARCGFAGVKAHAAHAGTYATLTVRNREEEINGAWAYLYGDWLQRSMFEQADSPYFEEYLLSRGRAVRLRLYLPIRRREDINEIRVAACGGMVFLVAHRSGEGAEEAAARAVVDFLASQQPGLLESAREFYVSKQRDGCTCGIRVKERVDLPDSGGVEHLTLSAGRYAVMSTRCCGDARPHEQRLVAWVADCGLHCDGPSVFALYEARDGLESDSTTMRLFCRLKDGKNG